MSQISHMKSQNIGSGSAKGSRRWGLVAWGFGCVLLLASPFGHAQFAREVVHYDPGLGFATEFGSGLGYTNTATVLGAPSRSTAFGDSESPVDPFSSPFTREQLLSLGTNGVLTVRLDSPIYDDPANPFGLDFVVFGNTGFVITNGDYSGGGITSGAMFGANPGATRISVSANGRDFFLLDPQRAPVVDGPYPTDGAGDFLRPVDPTLKEADFGGLGLAGIRARYAGSGGGTGYDLGWARTATGEPARLGRAEFVRFEVVGGRSEIDGLALVLDRAPGAGFTETFGDDQVSRGWIAAGDPTLFAWDTSRNALRVTWDSSRTNSFLYRPLGTVLTAADDFTLTFDVDLDSVAIGTQPGKPSTFQIGLGLLNLAEARRTNFFRGAGIQAETGARSLVEWNYFPDSGFGATLSPSVFATNNTTAIAFTFPFELATGVGYRVTMHYGATNRVLRTSMLADGLPMAAIKDVVLPADATFDFRLDAVAVISYSDAGQSGGEFDGSILARGWVDNVRVSLPPPVSMEGLVLKDGKAEVRFVGRKNWRYTLERSGDLATWVSAGSLVAERAGALVLRDGMPSASSAIYRVRAEAP